MAIFQVDIQKSYQGEFWTNVYKVEAPDISSARGLGERIVDAERDIHLNAVAFDKMRVSTDVQGDNNFVIVPISSLGRRDATQGTILPLFNTAVVLLSTGFGRPGRKYYRGVLMEGNIADDLLQGAILSELALFCADLLAIPIVKDALRVYTQATPVQRVGMRQLRRGSRRRARPVIS